MTTIAILDILLVLALLALLCAVCYRWGRRDERNRKRWCPNPHVDPGDDPVLTRTHPDFPVTPIGGGTTVEFLTDEQLRRYRGDLLQRGIPQQKEGE